MTTVPLGILDPVTGVVRQFGCGELGGLGYLVYASGLDERQQRQLRRHGRVRIGRNEPCPCGSGRRLRRCCLLGPLAEPRGVPPRLEPLR